MMIKTTTSGNNHSLPFNVLSFTSLRLLIRSSFSTATALAVSSLRDCSITLSATYSSLCLPIRNSATEHSMELQYCLCVMSYNCEFSHKFILSNLKQKYDWLFFYNIFPLLVLINCTLRAGRINASVRFQLNTDKLPLFLIMYLRNKLTTEHSLSK